MEVKVIRTLRRFLDEIDIVELPEGFRIAVPRWMLDPLACSQLPQEAKPRVALNTLWRLVEMIQSYRLPDRSHTAGSDTPPQTKGKHVSRKKTNLSSSPVASSQEDALGKVPRTSTRAVSSGVNSDPAASRAQGVPGKEPR
jgi:hypothetical protein